jgi:hypothetical protein
MPAKTSKDILKEAADTLKKNNVSEMAITDEYEQVLKDCRIASAALKVARQGMGILNKSVSEHEDSIKELEDGMKELKKNEAVMAAPADKKVYLQLMKEFEDRTTVCGKAVAKAESAAKECAGLLK